MLKEKIKKKTGFTLVELIIIITILAILATIAFVSFQGYVKGTRDSNRVTSIANVKKGLDLFAVQVGNYPNPDGIILNGTINGQTLVKVGEIQDTITKLVKINQVPKDPLTKTNFVYGTTSDGKYYQIASIKEDLNSYTPFINKTYAADGITAKVDGNYQGIIKFSSGSEIWVTNTPSLIFNNTGSVNLLSGSTYYVINKKQNLPYSQNGGKDSTITIHDATQLIKDITKSNTATLTGVNITNLTTSNVSTIFTGSTLLSFNISGNDISNTSVILNNLQSSIFSSENNPPTAQNSVEKIGSSSASAGISCLDILNKGGSIGNGTYWIKPDTNPSFQIYCDMTTDGGGWTLAIGIDGTNRNHLNTGSVTPNNLVNITGKGKLSDTMIRVLYTSHYRFESGVTGKGYFKTANFSALQVTPSYSPALQVSCTYSGTYTNVTGSTDQLGFTALGYGNCGGSYNLIFGTNLSGYNGCSGATNRSSDGKVWVK